MNIYSYFTGLIYTFLILVTVLFYENLLIHFIFYNFKFTNALLQESCDVSKSTVY